MKRNSKVMGTLIISTENCEGICQKILAGIESFNYNSDCFSLSDVRVYLLYSNFGFNLLHSILTAGFKCPVFETNFKDKKKYRSIPAMPAGSSMQIAFTSEEAELWSNLINYNEINFEKTY